MKTICLNSHTPQDEIIRKIFEDSMQAALDAADSGHILETQFTLTNENLEIMGERIPITYDQPIYLISIGKASLRMASVLLEKCGHRIHKGICVTKDLDPTLEFPPSIQVIQSSHPTPNEQSTLAAKSIEVLINQSPPNAFFLCAISGGASSLVVYPSDGISLEDYISLSNLLLSRNYSINEINTIRKHIDSFKGGGVLGWIGKRSGASLILSDVINNDFSVIASGPTVPDSSTYEDALKILRNSGDIHKIPVSILNKLEQGVQKKCPETLKPSSNFNKEYRNILIGSLEHSLRAACEAATERGLYSQVMHPLFSGPLEQLADRIFDDILQKRKLNEEGIFFYGGEGTVEIHGNGRGGRNSYLAWLLAQKVKGIPGVTILTIATDGDDGNSKAAGAILDGTTCIRAEQKMMDVKYYGEQADTATFFEILGDSVVTGITGTNVNDLVFVMVEKL